jgi:exodeoxyribonuclease-1
MRMVQVAAAVSPNTIAVPTLDDGRAVFRLGPVAEANEIKLDNAHEALADTGATLAMAQLVKKRHPGLWAQLLRNARKASVVNLIEDHPLLLLSETYAGRGFNFVAVPIVANSSNSSEWGFFDLQFDPTDYVDAPDDALKAALVGNKKVIRKVAANSQPGLLPLEFCPEDVRGGRLSMEVYRERSRIVREHSTFRGRVASLLAHQYADQPKPEHVEQRIYEGFPSRVDERRMSEFHKADWPTRAQIVEDIEDQRYRQFGRRVLATERLGLLSPERQRQYADWRRERLLTSGDAPWRTLSGAREEAQQLSKGASEGQRRQLLNIEEHLQRIEASLSA